VKVTLPYPTKSLNEIRGMNDHVYARLLGEYTLLVRLSVPAERRGLKEKRRVRVTRFGRQLDYDNLVGGCKPLVDALVRAGLIVDDSPDHVAVEYCQEKCKRKDARTEIEVW
jgi:Holliday junction resolvase RusA-like endonuclease